MKRSGLHSFGSVNIMRVIYKISFKFFSEVYLIIKKEPKSCVCVLASFQKLNICIQLAPGASSRIY